MLLGATFAQVHFKNLVVNDLREVHGGLLPAKITVKPFGHTSSFTMPKRWGNCKRRGGLEKMKKASGWRLCGLGENLWG